MLFFVAFIWLTIVACTNGQCPSGCTCISDTSVTCNGLTGAGFPEFHPDNASLIETLSIVGANIPVLNASLLENFVSLRSLTIWLAGLGYIEPGVFEPLRGRSVVINMQYNNIPEIFPGTFNGSQVSFSSITLRDNGIEVVHPGAFAGVAERGLIDLSLNALSTVPDGVFVTSYSTVNLGSNINCDCGLRWLPPYLNSTTTNLRGSCALPSNLTGTALSSLMEEMLLCPCVGCVEGRCDDTVGVCECDSGWMRANCSERCTPGTFGPDCVFECACVHSSQPCHHVNGSCFCDPGFTGEFCEQGCPHGTYGPDCGGVCQCVNNATCDPVTGSCTCLSGWSGTLCEERCSEGFYGQGCAEVCRCGVGACDPVSGSCTCPAGIYGMDCSHNCTGAMNCDSLYREPCSLSTRENTCGPCLVEYVGAEGDGKEMCTFCPHSLNCVALNRLPCTTVDSTCGPCYTRFLTASGERVDTPGNETCFDPCKDGVLNYNETEVDCGGPWCRNCTPLVQTCLTTSDCGSTERACVEEFVLPSGIPYEYDLEFKLTCVNASSLGRVVLDRLRTAFQQRFALPGSCGLEESRVFLQMLKGEFQTQFRLKGRELFDSLEVRGTEIEEGKFVYNVYAAYTDDSSSHHDYSTTTSKVITNIHEGQLKATVVFSSEKRSVRFSF